MGNIRGHSFMMVPIEYRQYWDHAREFAVTYRGQRFWLVCDFSDELDDYPPDFEVYELSEHAQGSGSWRRFAGRSFGKVPTSRVTFDTTRKKLIDPAILEEIGVAHGLWQEH